MPRGKKQGSLSQAIREVLEQSPKLTAKEVVEQLGQKGTKVTPGLVYMVKGGMKQSSARRKRKAARMAQAVGTSSPADPVALIRRVKELAHEAGGMKKLEELIAVLAH